MIKVDSKDWGIYYGAGELAEATAWQVSKRGKHHTDCCHNNILQWTQSTIWCEIFFPLLIFLFFFFKTHREDTPIDNYFPGIRTRLNERPPRERGVRERETVKWAWNKKKKKKKPGVKSGKRRKFVGKYDLLSVFFFFFYEICRIMGMERTI